MVRFRSLRLFRAGAGAAVLPVRRSARRADRRLWRLRGRLRDAAYWCCGPWNHRRPRRTALRAAAVGDADGRRHNRDRAAANLCSGRHRRAGAAAPGAIVPGLLGRRRIHRLGRLSGRDRAARTARLRRQHGEYRLHIGRVAGLRGRRRRRHLRRQSAARILGVAASVPARRRAGDGRAAAAPAAARGWPPPKRTRELPLKRAFARDPRTMAVAILFTSGYGVVNYLTMMFFPVYAGQFGGLSEARALQATTVAQALALVIVPLAGLANDAFIRRRTLLMIAFAAEFAVALAFFLLARDGALAGFALAQLGFGAILALVMGTDPAMLSEQFPGAYRMSGYSAAFNLRFGIGGRTPA